MKQKNVYKYDKDRNITTLFWAHGNTQVNYKYIVDTFPNHRKEVWVNPKNKSNFKTIVKSTYSLYTQNWQSLSMLEIGEIYITYYKFKFEQDKNHVQLIRRFNIKSKNVFSRTVLKDDAVWIDEYKGKKTMGFKINTKKLK